MKNWKLSLCGLAALSVLAVSTVEAGERIVVQTTVLKRNFGSPAAGPQVKFADLDPFAQTQIETVAWRRYGWGGPYPYAYGGYYRPYYRPYYAYRPYYGGYGYPGYLGWGGYGVSYGVGYRGYGYGGYGGYGGCYYW